MTLLTEAYVREDLRATIRVACADPERARSIHAAIGVALERTEVAVVPPSVRVVRLRTRKRAEALTASEVGAAIVVVSVTERSARHLLAIVDAVRRSSPLAIQLAWDGRGGERVEAHVFATLEQARATPGLAPVLLASSETPCFAARAKAAVSLAARTEKPAC